MLCFKRKRHEGVMVVVPPSDTPTLVRLKVYSIGNDFVRIAFDAPKHVQIDRGSVYVEKMNQGVEVGGRNPKDRAATAD